MRKLMYSLVTLLLLPSITCAGTYVTASGLSIPEEDYNNLLKIYPPAAIEVMSLEKYNNIMSKDLDFNSVNKNVKYVRSSYDALLHVTTEKEVTKEEFDSFKVINSSKENGAKGSTSTFYETVMKEITLSVVTGPSISSATLSLNWKNIPSTRSFDVIGFRGYNFSFINGTQDAEQIYVDNGVYNSIDYAWNGTHINRFTNGYGISMNIVNNPNITLLQAIADCDMVQNNASAELTGSYQHTTHNVSLADSMNYTLGGAGLGGVFVYPYSISQYYDGMRGVDLSFS